MGECFFWYRPTRVVPDQRPLNGCVCVCVCVCACVRACVRARARVCVFDPLNRDRYQRHPRPPSPPSPARSSGPATASRWRVGLTDLQSADDSLVHFAVEVAISDALQLKVRMTFLQPAHAHIHTYIRTNITHNIYKCKKT